MSRTSGSLLRDYIPTDQLQLHQSLIKFQQDNGISIRVNTQKIALKFWMDKLYPGRYSENLSTYSAFLSAEADCPGDGNIICGQPLTPWLKPTGNKDEYQYCLHCTNRHEFCTDITLRRP